MAESIDLAFEEKMYSAGYWYDGSLWKPVSIKYIFPGEKVRKTFRKLLAEKERLYFVERKFSNTDVANFMNFLSHKYIPCSVGHIDVCDYWREHPKLKALDVYFDDGDTPVATELSIAYTDFVVSQFCIPVELEKFYSYRMGHRISLALPYYYNSKYLVGYLEEYEYVKR